ncbi:MAG: SMC family ATPase, partial [Dehalococcoidales bacterium]|nr:SMC family ATPase [Dehalococcoidales bacterium]
MIPIRLSLHNFMCYRDGVPPLSFAGIHTACIAGANGNGKSTLIDAMTWALWGKARAKNDDDLVHLGETEMAVEFDFAVGGQSYRILRKHSRPKGSGRQGKTVLEFQIASDGGFRPLTGSSITQTQQKIIETLHMDYATFVNSALLLQGRADEFTIKRPVERKQVLADILGLDLYDRLEEEAKERAREQETTKAQLESALWEIDQELGQKPDYQAEYEAGQSQLSAVEKEVSEQEARLHSLRQEKEALEHQKTELVRLEERLARTKLDLKRWEDLAGEHRRHLEEYQALIAQRPTID